jgi:hypothetical protein
MAHYMELAIKWMQMHLLGNLLYGDMVLIVIVMAPWCIVEIINRTNHGQMAHSLSWILIGMVFTLIFFALSLCSYLIGGLLIALLIFSFIGKMWL